MQATVQAARKSKRNLFIIICLVEHLVVKVMRNGVDIRRPANEGVAVFLKSAKSWRINKFKQTRTNYEMLFAYLRDPATGVGQVNTI